jgi:nitrite reductase/ring-hydroxylating ferredoxin subunit
VVQCGAVTPIAVYRRSIQASLARVWENVLDWEHLPWLHAASFTGVDLVERSAEHWRTWVTLPGDNPEDRRALIDVRLARPDRHYWTRTLEGAGAGTGIKTALTETAPHVTDIAVAFDIPDVPIERAPRIGAAYVDLYARLWDEDEAMMRRRQRTLDGGAPSARAAHPPLRLGPLAVVRARLPWTLVVGERTLRLIDVAGTIVAHDTVCPHLGGPLDAGTLADGIVTCPWHGYRFDVTSGASIDGRRLCLAPAPQVVVDDGDVVLRPSRS